MKVGVIVIGKINMIEFVYLGFGINLYYGMF